MYTYKDRKLTKEQVDKLAAEKGVEVDVFLTNNPDIQIQEAVVETTEPEGKTTATELDTTVDATEVSDTESPSADGSLEYTDVESYEDFYRKGSKFTPYVDQESGAGAELRQTAAGGFEPLALEEVVVTGEDKTKQKQARDSQIAISELSKASKIPETAITMGAGIAATTVDIAKGFLELTDKYGVVPINYAIGRALGYDTTLRKEADASIENYAAIEDVTNLLREYTLRKYDSKGNEQDVYGLIEQGNYTDAAELAANQGFSAAPYLALSIASPVYGSALIGASVTGQEVVEGLKNRPEATLSEIYGASLAKGGVEFATNAIGGGIQRGILGIGKKLGTNKGAYKKAVDIYTKTYLGKVADVGFGLAKGGATNFVEEASASIGNAIVDKTVYGQEYSSLIRNAVNDGIVGLALGAPIGGAGGFKSIASKQQALEFLAPKKWTQDLAKQSMRLAEAQFNLDNAPTNKKEKFQKKAKKIESIIEMKKQQLYSSFDGFTKKEKTQYAENLDKIDSALGEIGNRRYTKGQQEDAQKELEIATKQNEALVGTELFDAKIEENIAKVLKNRELIAEAEEKAKGIKKKDLKIVYLEEVDGEKDAIFERTVDGKTTIYVNKRIAEQTGQTNALGHELLHYITNNAFETDNESVAPLVESFKEYLKETQPDIHRRVQERIDANYTNEDGSIREGALEEYFNVFSDLVAKEKIVINESFSDKIKNSTKKFLNGLGFGGVKLETGKDVFDFIRNYQDNVSKFKFKQLDITLESSKLKTRKASEDKLIDDETQTDEQITKDSRSEEADLEVSADNLIRSSINEENTAIVLNPESTPAQIDKAKTALVENNQGIINNVINKNFKQGLDTDLTREEFAADIGLEVQKLINTYGKNKKTGEKAPFGVYLRNNLPLRVPAIFDKQLQTVDGNIVGKVDISKADQAIDESSEIDIDKKKEKPVKPKESLRKSIPISDAVVQKVRDAVIKTFGTKLPSVESKDFKEELRKAFRTELKTTIAKEVLGTRDSYETFLRDNFEAIYDAIPQEVINKRFKAFKKPVLKKDGKQLRENTAQGNAVFEKKKISKAEFIKNFLGRDVGTSTKGTRKDALAETLAEEFAFDATPETIQTKSVKTKRKFIDEGQSTKKVTKAIGRPVDLKFSLSTKQDLDWSIDEAENRNTSFAIGDKTYNVQLNARDLGADQDADPTDYSLEFDQDGSQELTGKGDQFKAVSVIYNGLIDEIKSSPNIATISFNALASETSRVKLYDVLLDKLSKELGWTAEKFDYESDGVIDEIGFEMYKPEKTAKEQPTLKFSKSNLTKKQLNLVKQQQGEIIQRFVSSDRSVKSMRLILSDVLKDAGASDKTISKYAKELTSPAKKFIVDLEKQLVTESDFGEVTNEQIEQALSAVTLKALLDIDVNPGGAFDSTEFLNKFRKLQHEYQLEQIKKLGNLDGIISILKFHKDYHTSAGKIGDGRYQGYAGSLDWFKATNKALKNKGIKIKYIKTGTGVVPVNILINNVEQFKNQAELKAKIKTFSQSNNLKRETVEAEYDARKEEAGEGFDAMVDYLGFISSKGDKLQFGMSLMALKSNMSALGKRVAYVKYFYNGKSDSATVFEHMLPSLYTLKEMVKNFYEGGVDLEALKESQQVAMIPRDMDKRINIVHQASMPSWFKLGMSPLTRYFNALTKGYKNMFALESIGGKDKGVVYGEDHLALNNSVLKASKSNNNILPDELKLKGDFINDNVLNEMSEIDDASQAEELKFSKSLDLDKDFNDIIENKTGIASNKTYARVKAEVAGANKGKFNFFIPPSAEDFVGLLYSTLGKGSIGDAQMAWYKAHLLNPFARAMENLANDRANMMQDFRGLKKSLKIVPKNLRKKIKDSDFTQEQAVRAYIWDQQGMEIPGLSKKDQQALVDFVNEDANLTTFADQLIAINKGDAYAAPDAGWVAGNIGTDFIKALNTTKRSKYLEVWQQNVDQIFSEANLNKLEAAYGANYREAMVDMLKRMKTGKNTSSGSDRLAARFTDWLTNSVGAIMFFNTRSAVLQTISAVNFINFSDNNVLKAGAAFANQPQYWSDFKKLFNSPFLLDRRSGLKLNVNEADIAAMAKGPGNGARNVIAGILKAGFLPTQLADSFAIASGGASFYRNRIKALQKEGLTEAEAEEQAFRDFREIAEESQQSSRPDKISQQQAGPLGRVVLAFANTPAQYARLIKKAASDLKNGRGDAKTNISKIIYYGVAQNLLFSALQQALFAIAFDDEEEEEKKNEKYFNIVNGMSDSVLRGIGIGGAIVSVVKNTALKLAKEADKKSPKYQDAVVKGILQISPPISSKVGKLQSAGRSYSWNQEEMRTRGWSIDNPAYLANANVISALTNVPLDRAVKKVTNIVDAGNEDIEYYKRVALALGWSAWELGIDKKGGKVTPPKTDMDKLYDLTKKQQIDSLTNLGISKKQIKLLKLEEDRVNAILNPKSIKQIKVSKRDSLFGLNKKDQVKALEKLGLTKKEIRALRLESDRVEAIINKQKKEVE